MKFLLFCYQKINESLQSVIRLLKNNLLMTTITLIIGCLSLYFGMKGPCQRDKSYSDLALEQATLIANKSIDIEKQNSEEKDFRYVALKRIKSYASVYLTFHNKEHNYKNLSNEELKSILILDLSQLQRINDDRLSAMGSVDLFYISTAIDDLINKTNDIVHYDTDKAQSFVDLSHEFDRIKPILQEAKNSYQTEDYKKCISKLNKYCFNNHYYKLNYECMQMLTQVYDNLNN